MAYCLNPACSHPQNEDGAQVCAHCGNSLWLAERYLPLRLLGQGAFGRTVLAWDSQPSRPAHQYCVIKQTLPVGDLTAEILARRQTEVEQLRSLGHHPQIPALIDDFSLDSQFFIVQDYIDGPNLDDQLATVGAWSEAQVRSLLESLLPVLDFIHRAQVIHRDIKPANIIAARPVAIADAEGTERDPRSAFVLVDFGAAKRLTTTAVRQAGTVIGSAAYAAPEQTLGNAEFASDLYSLGVTCLHLLTGEHPFDLYSVAEDGWRWQSYLAQPVSSRLVYVLNKLTRRPLAQRYATAAEALRDLQAAPRSRTPRGSAPPRWPRRSGSPPLIARPPAWFLSGLKQAATAIATELFPADNSGSVETPTVAAVTTRERSPAAHWSLRHRISTDKTVIQCLAVDGDRGDVIAGDQAGGLRSWRYETGTLNRQWPRVDGHRDRISGLLVMSAEVLLSSSDDGRIHQWNLATLALQRVLTVPTWKVTAIARDATGALLVSGGSDGQINLWDWRRGQVLRQVQLHSDPIIGLAVASGSPGIISSSGQPDLLLWDGRTGDVMQTLTGHQAGVTTLVTSVTGHYLISGDQTGLVKLWRLPQGTLLHTLAKHNQPITAIAMSPDESWFATADEAGEVLLWDLRTGLCWDRLPPAWGITAIAAPSPQDLVTASQDQILRCWHRVPPSVPPGA